MAVLIGRPINGISINGLEYVCDDEGIAIAFENEERARDFLHKNGVSDESIEDCGIVFEEVEEEDDV